jgi:hypothetical protein
VYGGTLNNRVLTRNWAMADSFALGSWGGSALSSTLNNCALIGNGVEDPICQSPNGCTYSPLAANACTNPPIHQSYGSVILSVYCGESTLLDLAFPNPLQS